MKARGECVRVGSKSGVGGLWSRVMKLRRRGPSLPSQSREGEKGGMALSLSFLWTVSAGSERNNFYGRGGGGREVDEEGECGRGRGKKGGKRGEGEREREGERKKGIDR